MARVTAETITDVQITELRLQLAKEMQNALPRSRLAQAEAIGAYGLRSFEELWADFKACDAAIGRARRSRRLKGFKAEGRKRAAEIYNARHGKAAAP